MANKELDPELAAMVLIEAAITGDDKATAKKYGISRRTLQRWRARMMEDTAFAAKLSQAVAEKKELVQQDWVAGLPKTIQDTLDFLSRAAKSAPIDDHQMVYSMAGALKILTDAAASMKVLDVRLRDKARSAGAQNQPMASGRTAEPDPRPNLN